MCHTPNRKYIIFCNKISEKLNLIKPHFRKSLQAIIFTTHFISLKTTFKDIFHYNGILHFITIYISTLPCPSQWCPRISFTPHRSDTNDKICSRIHRSTDTAIVDTAGPRISFRRRTAVAVVVILRARRRGNGGQRVDDVV